MLILNKVVTCPENQNHFFTANVCSVHLSQAFNNKGEKLFFSNWQAFGSAILWLHIFLILESGIT